MLLITVEKCLDTGLAAQICISGQKRNEFLVVQFNATTGINLEEGLIDFLLVDALVVEAQFPCIGLCHDSSVFNYST